MPSRMANATSLGDVFGSARSRTHVCVHAAYTPKTNVPCASKRIRAAWSGMEGGLRRAVNRDGIPFPIMKEMLEKYTRE
jgi:hypothetical protein